MTTDVPDPAEAAPSPLWPLTEVRVAGLFARNDVTLHIRRDAAILTGENGSGKSTILRAIHLLAAGHWRALAELPVTSVAVAFEDGTSVTAAPGDGDLAITDQDGRSWETETSTPDPAFVRRRREADFLQHRLAEVRSAEERRRLQRQLDVRARQLRDLAYADVSEVPDWVADFVARFSSKLISARRLEHRLRPDDTGPGDDAPISVVDRFALDLAERMRDQLSLYAAESRRQEKVLPSQIVQAMSRAAAESPSELAADVDAIRSEVRELADSLARVGLFQEEDPDTQFMEYPRDNPNILLAIREVYRVTHQRLERLTDLRSDLELFAGFLNERLTNKRVELNQRSGIEIALDTGDRIRPSELSSGEQQLLALAYELLFQTEPRSVVLLDEPELSLHVAWLKGLISAFLEMGQGRQLQFVIATHSPSVLAGHLEREQSLDELPTHGAV